MQGALIKLSLIAALAAANPLAHDLRRLETDDCANSTLTPEGPCCELGQEWDVVNDECADCVAGEFGDGYVCETCPTDEYSTAAGATECTSCGDATVTNTGDSTGCECVTATDVLVDNGDGSFVCFDWASDCPADVAVTAPADVSAVIFTTDNTTVTVDNSGCSPSEGGINYFWEIWAPSAGEADQVEVETSTASVDYAFEELGDWDIVLWVCSDQSEPSADSCSQTSITLTVISPCESGEGYVHDTCTTCSAGEYGDGADCIACDGNNWSGEGFAACLACPTGTTVSDDFTQCDCDDTSLVAVYTEPTDDEESTYWTCETPVITVTWVSSTVDGSAAQDVPFTYTPEVTVTVEPAGNTAVVDGSYVFSYTDDDAEAYPCAVACEMDDNDDAVFETHGSFFMWYVASLNEGAVTQTSESLAIVVNDAPVLSLDSPATSEDNVFELTVDCTEGLGSTCSDSGSYAWTMLPDGVADPVLTAESTVCASDSDDDGDDDGSCPTCLAGLDGQNDLLDDAYASCSVDFASEACQTDLATCLADADCKDLWNGCCLTADDEPGQVCYDCMTATYDDGNELFVAYYDACVNADGSSCEDTSLACLADETCLALMLYCPCDTYDECVTSTTWDVTGTDPLDTAETVSVTLIVTDEFGAGDEVESSTAVNAQSFTPVFTDEYMPSYSSWTAEDDSFSFTIGTDDADEGDSVSCAVTTEAAGASVDSVGDCVVTMTFTGEGTYAVEATLSDDAGNTNVADLNVYVYADDIMDDGSVTRPDTVASMSVVAGAALVDVTFDSGSIDADTGAINWDDDFAEFTIDSLHEGDEGVDFSVDVQGGYIGSFAVAATLELDSHFRTATAVVTSVAATPTVDAINTLPELNDATDESPAYVIVDSVPQSFEVQIDSSIDDGSVATVYAQIEGPGDSVLVDDTADDGNFLFDADSMGTYSVAVVAISDEGMNSDISWVEFTVLQALPVDDSAAVDLTANADGSTFLAEIEAPINDQVPYGSVSYLWEAGDLDIFVTQDENGDNVYSNTADTRDVWVSVADVGAYDLVFTMQAELEDFAEGTVAASSDVTVTVLEATTSVVEAALSVDSDDDLTDATTSFTLDASDSTSSIGEDAALTYAFANEDDGVFSIAADGSSAVVTVTGDVQPDTEYTFSVTVTDDLDTEATASQTVSFLFHPEVAFTVTSPVVLAEGEATFTVSVTITDADGPSGDDDDEAQFAEYQATYYMTYPSGESVEYGPVDAVAELPVTVEFAGEYVVSMTVTDADGLTSEMAEDATIQVYTEPEVTVPQAQYVTRPGENEDAFIDVTASATDAIDASGDLTWAWTVDSEDATLTNEDTATVRLTSGVEAVYTLTATATNTQDLSTSATVTVEVLPTTETRVTVYIESDDALVVIPDDDSAVLDGSNSFSSADPNDAEEAGLSYAWTLTTAPDGAGDAAVSADDSATGTLSALTVAGTYTVTLTVTDLNDQEGSATFDVVVTHAPTIDVTESPFYSSDDDLPESFTFDASASTDEDGDAVTFSWELVSDDCDDVVGSSDDSAEDSLVLSELERGLCVVELTVTDEHGASSTEQVAFQAVSLTVSSPNEFTTWYQGFTYDIEWSATGFSSDNVELFVEIDGYDDLAVIIDGGSMFDGASEGSFEFTVPTDFSGEEFNSGSDASTRFFINVRVLDTHWGTGGEESVSTDDFLIYPRYNYATQPWGECVADDAEADCGAGTESRTYECQDSNGDAVADYFCDKFHDTPVTSRTCNAGTCPDPYWVSSDWSDECETTETDLLGACGAGTLSRENTCYNSAGEEDEASVCEDFGLTTPDTEAYCSAGECQTYAWELKSTGDCSAECKAAADDEDPVQYFFYGCRNTNTGFWVSNDICANIADDDDSNRPESATCNTDLCPQYQWSYGDWSDCSAECDGGSKERTAECIDSANDDAVVADSNCDGDAVTEAACNVFACVYYWYDVGSWSDECVLTDDSAECGEGTNSRDVYCISSDDDTNLNTDLTACADLAFTAATTRDCVVECDFCDLTTCSGRGVCDPSVGDDGECVCDAGFEGTHCEDAGCAFDAVVDGNGECCVSVVEPATSECCGTDDDEDEWTLTPVLDSAGACCSTGRVDACGNCCASEDTCNDVLDVDGACCGADELDAASICCTDADVDACGVCGGDGSTCATKVVAAAADAVDECAATLADNAQADLLRADRQESMAVLLGIAAARVRVGTLRCASEGDSRRRLLANEDQVEATYTILPGASTEEAVSTSDVAATLADNADDFASVDEVEAAGVCGNDICESGEQCAADGSNAVECCLQDCPLVAQECAVPEDGDGSQCGGNGQCVQSSGACNCFTSQGYTGDACDECAVGFYASGSGSDFRCIVQVTAIVDDAVDDDSIDRDDVLRALAVALPMAAMVGIVFLTFAKKKGICGIRRVQRKKPLFNEQMVRSAELTSI